MIPKLSFQPMDQLWNIFRVCFPWLKYRGCLSAQTFSSQIFEVNVGMLGMHMLFASWNICLDPYLGHIICDKYISFNLVVTFRKLGFNIKVHVQYITLIVYMVHTLLHWQGWLYIFMLHIYIHTYTIPMYK